MRTPFSLGDLHPLMRGPVTQLLPLLNAAHARGALPNFRPFEGYRSPEEQRRVLLDGTSKAGAWQSAHQWGLAVDFVPYIDGRWTWDVPEADWTMMHRIARQVGLVAPINWDKPHLQHPRWESARAALRV